MPQRPRTSANRRVLSTVLSFVLVTAASLGLATEPASAQSAADENALFQATNQSRAANGLGPLQYDPWASSVANNWANWLAGSGVLQHNPNLVRDIEANVTRDWTRIGENVGFGPSVASLQTAFMNSPSHRQNILGPFNRVGIGATRDANGTLWVVVDFVQGPPIGYYEPPGTVHFTRWYMRSTPTPGPANTAFDWGISSYMFVSGDWNGDGIDTVGAYANGWWWLRNSNSAGPPNIVIHYGDANVQPVVGDWNGDGIDTIGAYANGWWWLRNSNTAGPPNIAVNYGAPGNTPVVGDWNGDGIDTIGAYANGWWWLRNSNTAGPPNIAVNYGAPGNTPVVGDWNGDGIDTIGAYANGWWWLRNSNTAGPPNIVVNYGAPGYTPSVGKWNSSGPAGIATIVPTSIVPN